MASSNAMYCLICLKTLNASQFAPENIQEKIETCEKFFALTTRYMNLKTDSMKPVLTLKTHLLTDSENGTVCCNDCFPRLDSFTHMYDLWFCLKLEMDRLLKKVAEVIEISKLTNVSTKESNVACNEKFRKDLVQQVQKTKGSNYPQLKLVRHLHLIPDNSEPAADTASLHQNLPANGMDEDDCGNFDDGAPDTWSPENNEEPAQPPTSTCIAEPTSSMTLAQDTKTISKTLIPNPVFTETKIPGTVNFPASKETVVTSNGENERQSQYLCDTCGQSFSLPQGLAAHVKEHFPSCSYYCVFCKKWFPYWQGLKSHLRIHTREKPYDCKVCGWCFGKQVSLKEHLLAHTNTATGWQPDFSTKKLSRKCSECSMHHKSRRSLIIHVRTMHKGVFIEEKPYMCRYCEMRFPYANDRYRHEQMKHVEPQMPCPTCKKTFARRDLLNRHMKMHNRDDASYKCKFCDKLPPNTHCVIHEKFHKVNRKKVKCGKAFNNNSHLKCHMQAHDKESKKPVICNYCEKRFATKKGMYNHRRKCHKESPNKLGIKSEAGLICEESKMEEGGNPSQIHASISVKQESEDEFNVDFGEGSAPEVIKRRPSEEDQIEAQDADELDLD